MKYYRYKGRDVWHWHPECQHYPSAKLMSSGRIKTSKKKPTNGEFCNECRGITKGEKQL